MVSIKQLAAAVVFAFLAVAQAGWARSPWTADPQKVVLVLTDSFGTFSRACPTGKAEIYFSVGTAYGTPTIALPYKGDDGHKRYSLGEITLKANP